METAVGLEIVHELATAGDQPALLLAAQRLAHPGLVIGGFVGHSTSPIMGCSREAHAPAHVLSSRPPLARQSISARSFWPLARADRRPGTSVCRTPALRQSMPLLSPPPFPLGRNRR